MNLVDIAKYGSVNYHYTHDDCYSDWSMPNMLWGTSYSFYIKQTDFEKWPKYAKELCIKNRMSPMQFHAIPCMGDVHIHIMENHFFELNSILSSHEEELICYLGLS